MLDDQNESSVERIYWRNVIAMIISWTVWIPFQSACWIYFQAFLKELHITPFQIALISFAGTITLALMRIPGGYLTDKVGRRKIIILLTYVVVFDYLIYAYASNFQVVLIATLISSLALLYQPALNAIVADSLPKTKRGKGYLLINTLTSLASIASPLIALWALEIFNGNILSAQRYLYILAFGSGMIAAIVRTILLQETLTRNKIDAIREPFREILSGYFDVSKFVVQKLRNIIILNLIISFTLGLTYLSQYYTLYYLLVPPDIWSIAVLVSNITFFIISFPLGFLTDKIGRRIPLVFGTISVSIQLWLMALAPIGKAIPFLYIWSIIGAVGWAVSSIVIPAIEADLLPIEIRGRAYAILSLFWDFSFAFSQIIGGFLYENFGARMPFLVASIMVVPSIYFSITIKETLKLKKE